MHTHTLSKRAAAFFVTALLALNAVSAAGTADPFSTFYVATNGNDNWSGTLSEPNAGRSDGPFATIARAVQGVRGLKASDRAASGRSATVVVRGGPYYLEEPIVFTPADSGAPGAEVEYQAYPGEEPTISGGVRILGWEATQLGGQSVWVAGIPRVGGSKASFHELWINGQRRPRARHPNTGYLAVAGVEEAKPKASWNVGQSSFTYAGSDLKDWPTLKRAEVCVMNRWVESHLPILSVDASNHLVRFARNSVFQLEPGDLYYVENALEALDRPGEWYLDAEAEQLYYLPFPGESMEDIVAIAPFLSQLVRFEGHPDQGAFIEHLIFAGLTFAHTEWNFPSGFDRDAGQVEVWPPPAAAIGGFSQAAIGVPGAVWADGLRASRFEQCRFVQLGTYGLELARGCQRNRIVHSEFGDLGAGGLKLGETTIRAREGEISRDNEVSDCHIHDGGQFFHSAIGIWIGQSPDNRIVHNHIHDFFYTGISAGWTWGYGAALATNTIVEFNVVHHIGKKSDGDGPILSDMGGIYTLGLHTGSVIRNNIWHDCAGLRYGGWGIYFDEGTDRDTG